MLRINYKFLLATALSFGFISTVELPQPTNNLGSWVSTSNQAFAKSSGGRSGGGGFSRSSGGSSSGSRGSSGSRSSPPSRDSGSRSNDSGYRSNPGYSSGGSSVIVVPGGGTSYSTSNSSGGGLLITLLVLGLFGLIALFIIEAWLESSSKNSNHNYFPEDSNHEKENDIVTVSKLQVALFSQAKTVQSELSELSLNLDTNTPEGLLELLQESALVLLRNSDNWSHVLASSDSVPMDKAEATFNQFSLQERSKFSAETLTNVRGAVKQKEAVIPGLEEDPAAYIVVTLLVGTANDKPLFKDVRSIETLKEALEKVASVPSDYLMTFELLWSPQVEADSLTYDELLTEYTDMIQIV